jgi:hypothetical protein
LKEKKTGSSRISLASSIIETLSQTKENETVANDNSPSDLNCDSKPIESTYENI